jgi:hypothetical protein
LPRSFTDWLLLVSAAVAVVAVLILTYTNVAPTADAKPGNLLPLLSGTAVAFACALVAVGTDLQNSVNGRLGALANTSILQSWQGWSSLIGWGAFDAAMFQIVVTNPTWASQTFHFDVGNNLPWAGLVVGISAIIIIRSKLFKQGNVEWGAEWIYLWSSAQVLDAVNRKRINIKHLWEGKFRACTDDHGKYPTLFTDLEKHMSGILQGKAQQTQAALTQDFQQLRGKYVPSGDPNPDATINMSLPARRYLISALLDRVGHADLISWARSTGVML